MSLVNVVVALAAQMSPAPAVRPTGIIPGVPAGQSTTGGSFRVKHGSDAAEVTDVHEAGAGEVEDVVGEREMRIESSTKITDRGIRGERSGR